MLSTRSRPHAASPDTLQLPSAKPLLRGWFHAAAALAAVGFTVALCLRARADMPRVISLLVFGLAMVELYTVSALYHIGTWSPQHRHILRGLDHANIFVLIAGTYTPLCFNVLAGWPRVALLAAVWTLAVAGIGLTLLAPHRPRSLPEGTPADLLDYRHMDVGRGPRDPHGPLSLSRGTPARLLAFGVWRRDDGPRYPALPRWIGTALYIGMGWVAIFALPAFLAVLPWPAVATLLLGGLLYTLGGIVYASRRPDPFPRVLGFHEVFHLLVVAGGVAFALMIWLWVVPFPRA